MKIPDAPVLVRSVLVAGISISLPCLIIGMGRLLLHPPKETTVTLPIDEYIHSLLRGEGLGLLFAGLGVLALSPLLGVLAAAIGFLYRKERHYVLAALFILMMTLATFVLRAQ